MSEYFLDTSALVKRYINETGSVWVRALMDPQLDSSIIISQLAVAEMVSAFNRLIREGVISREVYQRARTAFRRDCLSKYIVFSITQSVVDLACELLERYTLRTLDAMQLATCLSARNFLKEQALPDVTFVSSDDRLLAAASSEGVNTENPNDYQ